MSVCVCLTHLGMFNNRYRVQGRNGGGGGGGEGLHGWREKMAPFSREIGDSLCHLVSVFSPLLLKWGLEH